MPRTKPRMDPKIFDIQCEILAAARAHHATNRSIAAALTEQAVPLEGDAICAATVSHFTTSSRPLELTLSHLVALARHAGEGQPAADVLGPLLAHLGLVAEVTGTEDPCRLHVIKENSDVNGGIAAGVDLRTLERELIESIDAQRALLASVRRDLVDERCAK